MARKEVLPDALALHAKRREAREEEPRLDLAPLGERPRDDLRAAIDDGQRADELRSVERELERHHPAEGQPDDMGAAGLFLAEDCGDVPGEIAHRERYGRTR